MHNCGLVFQRFLLCLVSAKQYRYLVTELIRSQRVLYQALSELCVWITCVLLIVLSCCVHGDDRACALQQVYEHAVSDAASLKKLIKQLLAIISRPARLLEVLVRYS